MSNRIVNRIRKLLALANDQQGTPEGDASLSRAMEMMAQYGINRDDVEDEPVDTTLDVTVIDISEYKYAKQQHILINRISSALNCYTVGKQPYGKGSVTEIHVFGRAVDRERVVMLFSVASPAMIASSVTAVPSGTYRIRLRRLSHMLGYSSAIADSLKNHETSVREEHGDSREVMLADSTNAEMLARKNFPRLSKVSRSRYSPQDYDNGYQEGSRFDTGKNSRLGRNRQLNA